MLHLLDQALESFLRATVPLDTREVDVSFNPPDREWGAGLNRPTVNIFLWNIMRVSERTMAGTKPTVVDGAVMYAPAPTPMEFRYLVTAWSARHEDEMELLGAVLAAVSNNLTIPADHIPPDLADVPQPEVSLAATGADRQSELWNALDGQLKPGLPVVIRSYIPGPAPTPAGPPTEDIGFSLNMPGGNESPARRRVSGQLLFDGAAGLSVRAPYSVGKVDPSGRFVVLAQAGDELVIESDPPQIVVVPDTGGVVVE